MDTMADRIRYSLDLRGMTPADLIRQKVLSKAGVYFLLDGTTRAENVRAATAAKLCKALSVNRDWLLSGKGPMEETASASQSWRIDPAILVHADEVVDYLETIQGGPFPRLDRLRELASVYNAAAEDGGKVSLSRMAAMTEAAIERREKIGESSHGRSIKKQRGAERT